MYFAINLAYLTDEHFILYLQLLQDQLRVNASLNLLAIQSKHTDQLIPVTPSLENHHPVK